MVLGPSAYSNQAGRFRTSAMAEEAARAELTDLRNILSALLNRVCQKQSPRARTSACAEVPVTLTYH